MDKRDALFSGNESRSDIVASVVCALAKPKFVVLELLVDLYQIRVYLVKSAIGS
jgi:hypothetical protein